MSDAELRKKLRGYLRSFRLCQSQAKDIETMIKRGDVADCVLADLNKARDEFMLHCVNVRRIIGYTSGLEHRVLTSLFILGKKPECVAREVNYSQGYISNLEGKALKKLCRNEAVINLIVQ